MIHSDFTELAGVMLKSTCVGELAFAEIAARDDEPSVKAWETFIEYDSPVVPNPSRFTSYPAERHAFALRRPEARARARTRDKDPSLARSIIVTISVGHVSLSVRTWEV